MATKKRSARKQAEHFGWKPCWLRERDGKGGWILHPAQVQFIHWRPGRRFWDPKFKLLCPWGVVQMDNGETLLIATAGNTVAEERPVVSFSKDGGDSWTPLARVGRLVTGRPTSLTYLGAGEVMFAAGYKDQNKPVRFFSKDFGRTWPERAPVPTTPDGMGIYTEGNYMVDRDKNGVATRIAAPGIMESWPSDIERGAFVSGVHWSSDGGRTWSEPTIPKQWQRKVKYKGKVYKRGCTEGALVRAANGWIVAALRMDMHPKFFGGPFGDNAEGIGVSISKDDGVTWSPIQVIHEAGRHHTHLICMPDGTLVMTFIMRLDIVDGHMATYKRGVCALLSYDNGLTWDTEHEYLLHGFDHADGTPAGYSCGHVYSALLTDGSILTSYMNIPTRAACLVKWKPAAR